MTASACIPVLVAALLACASCARVWMPAEPGDGGLDNASVRAYYELVDRLCSFPRDAEHGIIVASVLVRGTSNGRPIGGRAWIGADYKSRSLRVESEPPSEFILTSGRALPRGGGLDDRDATLYLPGRRQVVLRESSRALLSTVLGLPLSADEFVSAFSGCADRGQVFDTAVLGPNFTRVSTGTSTASIDYFLQRPSPQSAWTLVAMGHDSPGRAFQWRADYTRHQENGLRSIHIVSEEADRAAGRLFDLDLSLTRIQPAAVVGPETFSPTVPADARPVPLAVVQRNASRPLVQHSTAAR